jgi:hypothetical protein
MGHLFYGTQTYANFHLWVHAMINAEGDSGVYLRSRIGPTTPEGWLTDGFQAQINASGPSPHKTGSLSIGSRVLVSRKESALKPNEWFTLEMIADGPRIIVKVNEQVTADYVEAGPSPRMGNITIRVVGPNAVVKVQGVGIKELPPGDGRLVWTHGTGKFEQVNDKIWLEQDNNDAWWFKEVGRTPELVHLHATDPRAGFQTCCVQLHRDAAWIQFDAPPRTKFYDGSWTCLPSTPVAFANTSWNGSETLANHGKLRFDFSGGDRVTMIDQYGKMDGTYVQNGAAITLRFGICAYTGSVNGQTMSGVASNTMQRWKWTVSRDP